MIPDIGGIHEFPGLDLHLDGTKVFLPKYFTGRTLEEIFKNIQGNLHVFVTSSWRQLCTLSMSRHLKESHLDGRGIAIWFEVYSAQYALAFRQ